MHKPTYINLNVKIVSVLILTLTLIACSRIEQKPSVPTEDIKAYVNALQAAIKAEYQAASVNNEWRDTRNILNSANEAAESGDFAKASQLANRAKAQYMMAAKQVKNNENELENTPFYDPNATPKQDLKKMQIYFRKQFPQLKNEDFANGFYALDDEMRANWESIEEFPPYSPAVEDGEQLWETAFKNNKTYKH